MRYLSFFIASAVTILCCSVLFHHDPELARTQINSGFFIFQCVVAFCAIASVIVCCLRNKRFVLVQTDYWVGLVLLLGTIANQINREQDFTKLVLLGIGYFTLRITYSQTQQTMKIAGLTLMLAGIAECWLGFRQLYGFSISNHSIFRLTGSFFNPGPYSGFLVIILPIALYWTLKLYPEVQNFTIRRIPEIIKSGKQTTDHLIFAISILCCFGIIMLLPAGMSRSAWIAGIVGCGIVLGQHYKIATVFRKYYHSYRKKMLVYGSITLIMITMTGTGMYLMKKDSADGRLLMWKISLLSMKEKPLLGVGPDYFPGAYGKAQAAYFESGKGSPQEKLVAGAPEYGFNEYLQIGVEYGIVGLIVFFGVMGSALYSAAHSNVKSSNAVVGSLTALLIFALFSYPFQIMSLCMVTIILLAMAGEKEEDDLKKKAIGDGIPGFFD